MMTGIIDAVGSSLSRHRRHQNYCHRHHDDLHGNYRLEQCMQRSYQFDVVAAGLVFSLHSNALFKHRKTNNGIRSECRRTVRIIRTIEFQRRIIRTIEFQRRYPCLNVSQEWAAVIHILQLRSFVIPACCAMLPVRYAHATFQVHSTSQFRLLARGP